MSNLLSYCGLVDAKIRASDKDLPLALLVDHILSEVRPATKELSAVLSTPTQY